MDRDKLSEIDELLTRAQGSALKSLSAVIDVEERLRAIHRACATDPGGVRAAEETPTDPR